MKIFAPDFSNDKNRYIEIEVSLLPGLPKFTIIGLPDSSLKEGILRLKSALIQHGFDWPRGQQVVVNLKPSGIKKLNKDLEFAIAVAFLIKTEQITNLEFLNKKNILAVGDLSLSGEVHLSKGFQKKTFYDWQNPIFCGTSDQDYLFDHFRIANLSDLKNLKSLFRDKIELHDILIKPEVSDLIWSSKEARLIQILALGEHSALIGGPQGCGKTTLVKQILSLMETPSLEEFEEIQDIYKDGISWRPQVLPHHSMPKISLIGGGVPPKLGEVTKAHHGIMILDEFLEFKKESIEVLREALQEDGIEISRLGYTAKFKTNFQALATTNLCPCGRWNGSGYNMVCSRSLKNCKSYIQRLVGPVVDRFDILWLKDYQSDLTVGLNRTEYYQRGYRTTQDILTEIEKVRQFRIKLGRLEKNRKLKIEQIVSDIEAPWLLNVYEFKNSLRRKIAFWRVARTLSELNLEEKISKKALAEAYQWTSNHFQSLG